MIDTGFNGDLELPLELKSKLKSRPVGRFKSYLAAGLSIVEDAFTVEFPLDGHIYRDAQATFVDGAEILIGTHLLQSYRLEVDFPRRTVILRHKDEA
jgi:predicted aspartyl protease